MKPLTYTLIGLCSIGALLFLGVAINCFILGQSGSGAYTLFLSCVYVALAAMNVSTLRNIRQREADVTDDAQDQPDLAAPCGGTCYRHDPPQGYRSRMYVCHICGNKRCPATNDCIANACTGSNATDQPGSYYNVRPSLPEPPPTIWADPAYYRTGPYGE